MRASDFRVTLCLYLALFQPRAQAPALGVGRMDERDGPDSDSDWEWLHELCKRPPPPAAADPGARSEWFEELLGNKEAARAGQQPGLTGAAVSGTAARRGLPEGLARAGQQAGLTGAGVSGTAARPDRLRGEQPGQTGSFSSPVERVLPRAERCTALCVRRPEKA